MNVVSREIKPANVTKILVPVDAGIYPIFLSLIYKIEFKSLLWH